MPQGPYPMVEFRICTPPGNLVPTPSPHPAMALLKICGVPDIGRDGLYYPFNNPNVVSLEVSAGS
jgi:hypothetical protein